jgi:HEAT repeat protein
MIQSQKFCISIFVAGLAIAFFCGTAALAQTDASDPRIQQAKDILLKGVASSNPDTRQQAVTAASLIGDHEQVVSKLSSMLETDKDVPVRITIVSTLGSFNDPNLAPILQKALKDPVPEVDLAAALALYSLKQPEGKDFLLEVLGGKAKTSSGFMSSTKRSMIRMVHTPSATLLGVMANQFALPGLGSGMQSAVGLTADPASSAQATVILALAKDSDPATWDAIVAGLEDKEWPIRAASCHAVALHNEPALREKLEPLLEDKKDQVRFRAAAAYLRLTLVAAKTQEK